MRQVKNSFEIAAIIAVFVAGASMFTASSTYNIANAQGGQQQQKNVVRDSQAILLEDKTIPANDYIHLYDSTPYMIINGHIAAKLPCDANNTSPLKVLIGQAPNLTPAELEFVKPLSTPGKMCIYHVDIPSKAGQVVTDIAIQNPTTTEIKLPSTSSIVIGVNEIAPLQASSGGNMTMSK
ncbi:MAG TPA: hypothetical protein VJ729_11580 [Nitrososphaeraceae archaeon]|nr:hypothetical protein [Nitrososphaeraceae archaeon]